MMPQNISYVAKRVVSWAQGCGLFFLLLGTGFALSAAIIQVFTNQPTDAVTTLVLGKAVYPACALALIFVCTSFRRNFGDFKAVCLFLGILSTVQICMISTLPSPLNFGGDARHFAYFLNHLAHHGFTLETLTPLTGFYDYTVWMRRALPFYYGLRLLSSEQSWVLIQIFQAFVLNCSLFLTWKIACRLCNRKVAWWAFVIHGIMPYQWTAYLDLNHHIVGAFYFWCALFLLIRWATAVNTTGWMACYAVFVGCLAILMRFEGSILQVFVFSSLLIVSIQFLQRRFSLRKSLIGLLLFVLLPYLSAQWVITPYNRYIQQAQPEAMSSGDIAFVTRGWMPETGGEYSGTYEQLDWLTPTEERQGVQERILKSQIYYNLPYLAFRLLPIKMAKFFLIGYASATEEMLHHNQLHLFAQRLAAGRTFFVLVILPLILWGGVRAVADLRKSKLLYLIVPCSIFALGTILLGETSPRYAAYVQPFLFILAGVGIALPQTSFYKTQIIGRTCVYITSLALTFFVAYFALSIYQSQIKHDIFQDAREWQFTEGTAAQPLPGTLSPFEVFLNPSHTPDGQTAWGGIRFPSSSGSVTAFYIFPAQKQISRYKHSPVIITAELPTGALYSITNTLPARIVMSNFSGTATFSSPLPNMPGLYIGYGYTANPDL